MSLQPLQLWAHWGGPNPWKVRIILEALHVEYNVHLLEFSEVKEESYLKLNPNGRLPTMQDPNTDVTLWESGAIIQYLIDQYDKDNKISYATTPEKYLTQQWLAFQMSGQGPYYGQAAWFARFHPEKIDSAVQRYVNEIFRVSGVIELALDRNRSGWLVGNMCTYADLSFVTWASVGEGLLKQLGKFEGFEQTYPLYTAWLAAMGRREDVKKVQAGQAKGRADHGLPP